MTPNERAIAQVAASVLAPVQQRLAEQGAAVADALAAVQRLLATTPPPPDPGPAPPPPVDPPAPPAPEPPPPPPAPEPPPPPPPAPAPPPPGVGLEMFALNPASTIIPAGWMKDGSSYERFQIVTPIDGDAPFPFAFRHVDRSVGWREFWASGDFTLMDAGSPVATGKKPQAGNVATINADPTKLTHGWHTFTVRGAAGEGCYPWPVFVRRDLAASDPPLMPVVRSSHDSRSDRTRAMIAWVPARFEPTVQPLPLRSYDHFAAVTQDANGTMKPMRREMFMTLAAPLRAGDVYRPRRVRGVLNTGNRQGYLVSEIHGVLPFFALLDGPRGRGTITSPTFIHVGREDAQGAANLYVIDGGYRLVRMAPDGTVTTLVGWRHKGDAAANNNPPRREDFDLLGDWSRIPAERHGLHEAWGLAWDTRTTVKGTGAPIPNPPRGLEPVHPGSVVAFIADTQNDRVLRVTFRGDVHDAPAVVEEFITGLGDPWGVVFHEGQLIIAERTKNRLSRWSADTGAFIGVLVEGAPGFAQLNPREPRRAMRLQSLAEIRKQPCCMPETVRILDGWAYYGGFASADCKRVSLTTGEVRPYQEYTDAEVNVIGAQYLVFDLSDGTVGQRGTVFACLWTSQTGPIGLCVLPDGTRWSWWDNGGNGPGMTWEGFGYGSAVGVGNGRIVCGWSDEGLGVVGLARGETTFDWDRAYKPALDAWFGAGLHLLYGPGGFGYYGLPLPWGKSAATDTYLEMHGHPRPA